MNNKTKIIAALIMSILLLGGGSVLLHNQISKLTANNDGFSVVEYSTVQPESIIPQVQLGESVKSGSRVSTQNYETPLPDMGVNLNSSSTGLSSGSGSYSGTLSGLLSSRSTSSGYRRSVREDELLYSSGVGGGSTMLMAYGGGSRSASNSSFSSTFGGRIYGNGIIAEPIGMTQPMLVPFKDNNLNAQALVDPGTEMTMTRISPVGDGLWVLLLLTGVYVFIRRKRV
ncbi:MAG: hypothetical protein GX361_06085 [Bacteroidales bacterium]|nr:hypothetical protein [Bacteroidales bacterium]